MTDYTDCMDEFNTATATYECIQLALAAEDNHDGTLCHVDTPWALGFGENEQEGQP